MTSLAPSQTTAPAARAADPVEAQGAEAFLARLLPRQKTMGITRLANLTGLDVLGIPVAAAVRPNSRSLAVHQGKGLTLRRSQDLGADGGGRGLPCRVGGRLAALGPAAGPLHRRPIRRACRAPRAAPIPERERFLWIEGGNLMSGATCWVPYELVHADFTFPQPAGSGLFRPRRMVLLPVRDTAGRHGARALRGDRTGCARAMVRRRRHLGAQGRCRRFEHGAG